MNRKERPKFANLLNRCIITLWKTILTPVYLAIPAHRNLLEGKEHVLNDSDSPHVQWAVLTSAGVRIRWGGALVFVNTHFAGPQFPSF